MQATFSPEAACGREGAAPRPLSAEHCAFFFDVDGTLIDIAIHPDAVVVPPQLVGALGALQSAAGGALALVSGRPISSIDALFSPLRLAASGVHGGEIRLTPEMGVVQQSPALPPELGAAIVDMVRPLDGVLMEDKGSSIAVHYRLNPGIGPHLAERLDAIIAQAEGDLRLLPGRLVFEVKRASFDKGRAVRQFMENPAFAGRIPVFMGDDVTDEAAFAVVAEMGGIVVSVGRDLPVADIVLPEAQDVRTLIASLATPQPEE